MAVGVANPNAHGQAMTNTEIITVTTNSNDSPPINPQYRPAKRDNPITIGTKIPATRSAIAAIGALEPCASSTKRII